MANIGFIPLLLLFLSPPYIRAEDQGRGGSYEELKSLIAVMTEVLRAQGERMENLIKEQQKTFRDLRKSLDDHLRENDLKIEWALTDGSLAPKNTSGIMEILSRQEKKIDETLDLLKEVHGYTYKPGSCAEIDAGGSRGVHHVFPNHTNKPVKAWCENSNGGGWTVIQKRFDGSVYFYRRWEYYAAGFGDPAGEYWLGLRHIHALTQAQPMELYVGVTDFDLGFRYARYGSFSVSSEKDKFRLNISGYSGNAGDALRELNGQRFTTKDQDNDPWSENCSLYHDGAWWYKDCAGSNLNALFSRVKVAGPRYMYWWPLYSDQRSMKASIMMIRPANFRP